MRSPSALRALASSGAAETVTGQMDAERSLHQTVLQAASSLLKVAEEAIDPRASLVEQGVTSLVAIRLSRSLTQQLEQPLPSTLVFSYPTIEVQGPLHPRPLHL